MEDKTFGRYRLIGLLGQGGMGQVFRAFDTATDRVVALKVLPPNLVEDPTFQQRFRREAHTAASLSDPHVIPIHSYGEIDGRLYVDMRRIEGRDLEAVLAEGGPMDPPRAVRIIEQVAEALDAAHSVGLVHRDIKPSNILLARRDFVYLIDFGIARALGATRYTRTGAAIGTLAYMAPERFDAEEVGPLSDVYALACVLHECLTGSQPFPGTSIEKQIAGHLTKPPPRPSSKQAGVSPRFDDVIAKGMAKNPDERFQTALELADAAREALDTRAAPVPPPPEPAVTEVNPTRPAPVLRPPPPRVPPPRPASPAPKPLVHVRTLRADTVTGAEESTGSKQLRLAGLPRSFT
jgi:serine/threonine protein kinase